VHQRQVIGAFRNLLVLLGGMVIDEANGFGLVGLNGGVQYQWYGWNEFHAPGTVATSDRCYLYTPSFLAALIFKTVMRII
jgi:hypothetical protein